MNVNSHTKAERRLRIVRATEKEDDWKPGADVDGGDREGTGEDMKLSGDEGDQEVRTPGFLFSFVFCRLSFVDLFPITNNSGWYFWCQTGCIRLRPRITEGIETLIWDTVVFFSRLRPDISPRRRIGKSRQLHTPLSWGVVFIPFRLCVHTVPWFA